MTDSPPRHFLNNTSWDEIGWHQTDSGIRTSSFVLGTAVDREAPVVFRIFFPPGYRVEPHHHLCNYAEIILSGTQQVTGHWHQAGDVRISVGNRGYGPLIAGPEGVEVMVIFTSQNWEAQFGPRRSARHSESQLAATLEGHATSAP
jgi:hypothetical protein